MKSISLIAILILARCTDEHNGEKIFSKMLYFVSLICHGCDSRGEAGFFDNDEKRPCFGLCGHSVCLKCVNLDENLNCPICHVAKAFIHKTINYGSWEMIKMYKQNPMDTFRRWWNGEEQGSGICISCSSQANFLRLCITCENSGKLKAYQKCIRPNEDKPETFQFYCWSEIEFKNVPSRVLCSNCIIEHHKGHQNVKLGDLRHSKEQIKYLTSKIATDFLWNEMLLITQEQLSPIKCQLSKMRLLRTCEALIQFSQLHHQYLEPSEGSNAHRILHFRVFSKVSKYLEPLEWEHNCIPHRELVEQLLKSLEVQWEHFSKKTTCQCSSWHTEMCSKFCENDIEVIYAELVMSTDLTENIDECPLENNLKFRKKVEDLRNKEFPKYKTHLLPTVFCWNQCFGGMCGVFDTKDHAPVKCRKCGNSTCLDCVKSNYMIRCPICGWHYEKDWMNFNHREFPINNKIVELIEFYAQNPIEVYQEWWQNLEPPGHGFCLTCSSHSEHIEVCIYCELKEPKNCAFRKDTSISELRWKYVAKSRFPVRWQCDRCVNRLKASAEHKYCSKSSGMERGCGHARLRLFNECRAYDKRADKCELSILALEKIDKSRVYRQFCGMEIVNGILRNGLARKSNFCEFQKIRIEKTRKLLEGSTKNFFSLVFSTESFEKIEKINKLKKVIDLLIENLQEQVTEQPSSCKCSKFMEKYGNSEEHQRKIGKFLEKSILSGGNMEHSDLEQLELEEDIDFSECFAVLMNF